MERWTRDHAKTARNSQRAPDLPETAGASVPRRECRRLRGGFFATSIDSAVTWPYGDCSRPRKIPVCEIVSCPGVQRLLPVPGGSVQHHAGPPFPLLLG